jgi:hypothetical protein
VSGLLGADLSQSPECRAVIEHPVFSRVREGLSREGADTFVGQFWHPSHFFPRFLAGLISVAPSLEVQTSLSRILWQELGEGDPRRAHESIYVETVTALGLSDPSAPEDVPLPATARLVDLYREASADFVAGLGAIFATEAIDLSIVRGLGGAVTAATGAEEIPWVDIHALQEPDHMDSATDALMVDLPQAEAEGVVAAAVRMWDHWHDFYSELEQELFGESLVSAAAGAAHAAS